jgi:hypothetical protein
MRARKEMGYYHPVKIAKNSISKSKPKDKKKEEG